MSEYKDESVAEVLSEMTGLPKEKFELSKDYEFPDISELESKIK